MGFTGRLGTGNSRLGNILLAAIDTLGDGTFDYQVHQIEGNKIRVIFNTQVRIPSATNPVRYDLDFVSGPISYVIPNIVNIIPYDADNESIILNLDKNLTTGATYSLELGEIFDVNGDTVSFIAKNFDANVVIPPLAKGAYLSKNGHVDILFDKNVGSTSLAATASIRDAAGGPLTPMPLVIWAGESLPEKTLRFQLPGGMPSANSFIIEFADIIDESQNIGSGEIPLTLVLRTPPPYDFSALNQIQIIDSYVTDVSNDQIRTSNLRVYFNGPVAAIDSLDTANWVIVAQDVHKNQDTINVVVAPAATDEPSLITLLTDLSQKINDHYIQGQVHFNISQSFPLFSGDPIDYTNELSKAFLGHLHQTQVHYFQDLVNDYDTPAAANTASAIILANQIRASYTSHIDPQPLSFSSAYPVGGITERANFGNITAYNVVNEYTYFVDLHIISNSPWARYNIEVTVGSEDASTSTNPADETGSMLSRSLDDPIGTTATCVDSNVGVNLFFDKEIYLLRTSKIEVRNANGKPLATEQTALSSLPALEWVYNQLIYAYSLHIGSNNGLSHKLNDTVNAINLPDYVSLATLSELISKANEFRTKLDTHISSMTYHYNPDTDITKAQPASNIESLTNLLLDLRAVYLRHNARDGVHDGIGNRIVSAKFYDTIKLKTCRIQEARVHTVSGMLRGYYYDNELAEPRYTNNNINETFIGSADRPSLASVIPKSGLVNSNGEISFESDSVEFYFSKHMQEVPLDSTNIILTGGSIQRKLALWKNNMVANVEVMKMEQISYNALAVDLVDEAGNLIY